MMEDLFGAMTKDIWSLRAGYVRDISLLFVSDAVVQRFQHVVSASREGYIPLRRCDAALSQYPHHCCIAWPDPGPRPWA
ncbi:hypothetical protein J6590_036062 [Homalodisca vitripennis]|nr:hypothetical protein J6590_036062 [Homalodisca vitripennis]